MLQYVIANSSHLVNTSFVGHLSDPALLSSMVLGNSLSMATGYSVVSGVASAAETFCGQAAGAGNYPALHAALRRALLLVAATCVPITAAWLNAEWLLTALGQPADIAGGAARCVERKHDAPCPSHCATGLQCV
jgi:multidrug resistance protein, MATE family